MTRTLQRLTEKTTILLLDYACHPVSKNMEWHQRRDLGGMCAIGAATLQHALKQRGIKATLLFGKFDPNTLFQSPIKWYVHKHCWLETDTHILDPTVQQFLHYIPDDLRPPTPLVAPKTSRHAKPYILGKPVRAFHFWPKSCHPNCKNAAGIKHQDWLRGRL